MSKRKSQKSWATMPANGDAENDVYKIKIRNGYASAIRKADGHPFKIRTGYLMAQVLDGREPLDLTEQSDPNFRTLEREYIAARPERVASIAYF